MWGAASTPRARHGDVSDSRVGKHTNLFTYLSALPAGRCLNSDIYGQQRAAARSRHRRSGSTSRAQQGAGDGRGRLHRLSHRARAGCAARDVGARPGQLQPPAATRAPATHARRTAAGLLQRQRRDRRRGRRGAAAGAVCAPPLHTSRAPGRTAGCARVDGGAAGRAGRQRGRHAVAAGGDARAAGAAAAPRVRLLLVRVRHAAAGRRRPGRCCVCDACSTTTQRQQQHSGQRQQRSNSAPGCAGLWRQRGGLGGVWRARVCLRGDQAGHGESRGRVQPPVRPASDRCVGRTFVTVERRGGEEVVAAHRDTHMLPC
jgi:hypothetical protein